MTLTPLAEPDYEAIMPLEEAKRHLRVVGDDENTTIEELRNAAIDWVETYASWALSERQFRYLADGFTSIITFPTGPVVSADAIDYRASNGDTTAMATADWLLSAGMLFAASTWPTADYRPGSVQITFTAGAPNRKLVQAAKLAMTAMDEDRANPNMQAAMWLADSVRQPLV